MRPLTAAQIADRLARTFPIDDPHDRTSSCVSDCRQLIVTDAVSVYQDAATAKRWAKGTDNVRVVGRYTLSFVSQPKTLDETRDRIPAEACA